MKSLKGNFFAFFLISILTILYTNCAQVNSSSSEIDSQNSFHLHSSLDDSHVNYEPPLVITKGGKYSGNWKSEDPNVAAVTVKTSEPVVLENCRTKSRGHGIKAGSRANLTVDGCIGLGLNPNVAGKSAGRFLAVEGFESLVARRNLFANTGGIYLYSWKPGQGSGVITITENYGINIDGRQSNGQNGFNGKFNWAQFVQLNGIKSNPKVEISWNKTLNEPRRSFTEDTVNLYESSGTASQKIDIHDNLFIGAYGIDPSAAYSGGGIMLGDGCDSGYSQAVNNTVIETSNYGIAIANGNHQEIRNNVVLGTGQLSDGTLLDAESDAGIYARNYCNDPNQDMTTNFSTGNIVGWGTPTSSASNARWDSAVSGSVAPSNQSQTRIEPTSSAVSPSIIEYYKADHELRAKKAGKLFGPI